MKKDKQDTRFILVNPHTAEGDLVELGPGLPSSRTLPESPSAVTMTA
jgi:hypothetical protein